MTRLFKIPGLFYRSRHDFRHGGGSLGALYSERNNQSTLKPNDRRFKTILTGF